LSQSLDAPSRRYGRQYLGLTINGKRVLQVRGFCKDYFAPSDNAYKRVPVMLLDSAGCVFRADYATETARMGELEWGTPGPP
jgi:hypothetical protein